MEDLKILALAEHLKVDVEEIYDEGCNEFSAVGTNIYKVLAEYEIEDELDTWQEDYIDEHILPEIPDYLRFYFNKDAFKRDMDNDYSVLAYYDGIVYDKCVLDGEGDKQWFYIYRVE